MPEMAVERFEESRTADEMFPDSKPAILGKEMKLPAESQ
jgi:hypothetical protein